VIGRPGALRPRLLKGRFLPGAAGVLLQSHPGG
jgi:hypothetical protein